MMATFAENVLSEEATRELEDQIPFKASMATKQTYQRARSSGQTVVVSRNGMIIAELPDGTQRVLGLSKPRRKVKAGVTHLLGAEAPKGAGA